jgi:hypothetical protein
MPKPDALLVHNLPGRIRLRVPGKKGDKTYFTELLAAISKCGGVQKMVINPATGGVLIEYEAGQRRVLDNFFACNSFFTVVERAGERPATAGAREKGNCPGGSGREKRVPAGGEVSRMIGMGLVGLSCYRLLLEGLTSPPWHAALWYGYSLLRTEKQETQGQTAVDDRQ